MHWQAGREAVREALLMHLLVRHIGYCPSAVCCFWQCCWYDKEQL